MEPRRCWVKNILAIISGTQPMQRLRLSPVPIVGFLLTLVGLMGVFFFFSFPDRGHDSVHTYIHASAQAKANNATLHFSPTYCARVAWMYPLLSPSDLYPPPPSPSWFRTEEYSGWKTKVLCHDCESYSEVPYHFYYLKVSQPASQVSQSVGRQSALVSWSPCSICEPL